MTKAYCTASTASLQVLAGTLPLDLALLISRRKYLYARKGFRRFGTLDLTSCAPPAAFRLLRRNAYLLWNHRWSVTDHAAITRDYLPSVLIRDAMSWLTPHYASTQFLTGHGHFQLHLWHRGLASSPLCDCGDLDDPMHMLLSCGLYEDLRDILKAALQTSGVPWPPDLPSLLSRQLFPSFLHFTSASLQRKLHLWRYYNFADEQY